MGWIENLIVLLSLAYLIYKWSTKTFKTFDERGVPYQKPIPLFGNALPILMNRQGVHKIMLNLYRQQKQHKVFGYYNFRTPCFVINDPDLVKKIGIKDFDSFTNHQRMYNADSDPFFRSMLTVMKDQRWKDMRNTVTPVFTSSKMRSMFTLMNECFEEAIKYLHIKFEAGKDNLEFEIKDCFSRLQNDLIATTAFGLKVNSFENPKNEFYTIGQALTKPKGAHALKFMLYSIAPKLFEVFRIPILDKDKYGYFIKLVVEAMKYREDHNIVRPDMIHLLMEAKRESANHWTNEDIVAQCFIFFFAAFENNATLICTICYELVNNQDIQQKLYEEIIKTDEMLKGKPLDYDSLKEMKYLDMVVQETMRKWTISVITDRECGKDYKVTDDDGKTICQLKRGDIVWFQIIGFHWDEEYFHHPEKFNPERFSEENKDKIKPYTYIPFGVGPRACIGNRYALMQAKAMIYFLLKEFKIEKSDKFRKNLMDDARGFALTPLSGFWFRLTKRH